MAAAACPRGSSCISARDVYKLTNSGKPVVTIDGKATALDPAPGGTERRHAAGPTAPVAASAQPALATTAQPTPGGTQGDLLQTIALRPEDAGAMAVVPLRTPSRVVRIWIAPWEDDAGRLHVPGFTYAEIEPRRWSIGENQPGRGLRLEPLPAPPAAQPPAPPRAQPERAGEPQLQDAGTRPTPRRQQRPPPAPGRQNGGDAEEIRFNAVRQDAPIS